MTEIAKKVEELKKLAPLAQTAQCWKFYKPLHAVADELFAAIERYEALLEPDSCAEARLDKLFDHAFTANHPAILDYIDLKFQKKKMRDTLRALKERIHFIGMPQEKKLADGRPDWSKEIAMIEEALGK